MREEFERLVRAYPRRPVRRDGTFAGNPLISLIHDDLPEAVTKALGTSGSRYTIRGSIGKGDWTHTPWLVLLDPAVTTTVERNYYVVYLLSLGCERLYLAIAQGCTTLKNSVGIPKAKDELARRAVVMRGRSEPFAHRLSPTTMNLNVGATVWRGKLYEQGCVLAKEYDARRLPPEAEMVADLSEALDLYARLKREGGWAAEDSMLEEAEEDQIANQGLQQSKTYRQHRTVERDPGHAKLVKKKQGTRCRACDLEMSEVFGNFAEGICDAHHLVPLATLEQGTTVTFDPIKDFAVLCPSCHRAIHRTDDPSDLSALRRALRSGVLTPVLKP
jgi:5-methylcytosine-specific restriction protein A